MQTLIGKHCVTQLIQRTETEVPPFQDRMNTLERSSVPQKGSIRKGEQDRLSQKRDLPASASDESFPGFSPGRQSSPRISERYSERFLPTLSISSMDL